MHLFQPTISSHRTSSASRRIRRAGPRSRFFDYLQYLEERQLMAGSPTQLAFGTAPAGTAASSPITVTVLLEDPSGAIVNTNSTDSIQLSISNGPTGATLNGNGTLGTGNTSIKVTVKNGVATFGNLSFTLQGSYILTALDTTNPNVTTVVSPSFTVGPAAAKLAILTPAPLTVTAGPSGTFGLSVQVEDGNNNLVTTDNNSTGTITITNPSGGVFPGNVTTTATASGGVITFPNLFLTQAGNYTLTIKDGTLTSTTATLTVTGGAATKLAFIQQPTSVLLGATITPPVTVAVEDAFGNIVTADSSTISLQPIGPGNTLNGNTSAPAVNGVATFNNLSLPVNGNYTLAASDTTETSLNSATSSSFAVIGPAFQLAFVSQPHQTTVNLTIKSGNSGNNPILVAVEDSAGNIVTGDTSNVTIASAGGNGTLGGTLSAPAVNGVASFNDLTLDQTGSTYTLVATDNSLTLATSNPFIINGLPAQLVFQAPPPASDINIPLAPAVSVLVEDSNGNIVGSDNSRVTLTLTNAGSTVLTGTKSVNAVNGVATFSNLIITNASTYTLTATDGILAPAVSNPFIISLGATHLTFATQPTNTSANAPMTPIVVSLLRDSGVVATSNHSTVALTILSGPGTITGNTTVAAVNGNATFTGLKFSTEGTYVLVASDASLDTSTSLPFTITGAPSQLVITQAPTTAIAGSANTSTFVVQLEDRKGNIVSDNSTITLTGTTMPTGGSIKNITSTASGNTTTVVLQNGIATFPNLFFTTAGNYVFTFSTSTTNVSNATLKSPMIVTPDVSQSQIVVTQQPDNVRGIVAGNNFAPNLVATVEDEFGNVITTDSSTVTLAPASLDNPGLGNFTGTLSVRANHGVATFTNVALSMPGTYTIRVNDASLLAGTTSTFTQVITKAVMGVSSNPGSINVVGGQLNVVVQASFRSLVSNHLANPTGNVTLTDQFGDVIANAIPIASNGNVKFTFTAPATAGSYICTVHYNGDTLHTGATSAPFTITVDPTSTSLSLTVGSPQAGQLFNFTAKVTNGFGNMTTPAGGTVTFFDGNTTLGTGIVASNGNATLAAPISLPAGNHTFKAVYTSADNFHNISTSATTTKTFVKSATTSVVRTPLLTISSGATLVLNFNLTPPNGNFVNPTGTITFKDGDVTIGTAVLTNGTGSNSVATLTINNFTGTGHHILSAIYAGDTKYNTSLTQTINLTVV